MSTADLIIPKTNLPTLKGADAYGALDIVGKTLGRYFDYKENTATIKYETQKLKEQTKILLARIEAELQNALDTNEKNYKQEMARLGEIRKSLKSIRATKKDLTREISRLNKQLCNPHLSIEHKNILLQAVTILYEQLSACGQESMAHIAYISDTNPPKHQMHTVQYIEKTNGEG